MRTLRYALLCVLTLLPSVLGGCEPASTAHAIPGASGGPSRHVPAGGGGYSTADFVSDALTVGGSELQEFWIAVDDDTYRTMDTGVGTLIGQKSAINLTQATGSQQPAMQAGSASNGRDQIRFSRSSDQYMESAEGGFPMAVDERWAVLFVGKFHTSVAGSETIFSLGNSGNGAIVVAYRLADPLVRGSINWNNTGSEDWDPIDIGTSISAPMAVYTATTSPHEAYLNTNVQTSAETGGISTRATGGANESFAVGGSVTGTDFANSDLWCAAVFKMSGTTLPTGVDDIIDLARTYYDEAGL